MSLRNIISSIILVVLTSCSVTKYVPDNSYLLYKNKIKSSIETISTTEMENYVQQRANQSILGISRFKLNLYNLSGRDTTKGFNQWLRRIGEPPVIYDQNLTDATQETITKVMQNKGYLEAEVRVILKSNRKKLDVTYLIEANTPYHINNYEIILPDDTAAAFVARDTTNIPISGDLFDVDDLNAERDRIVSILRRHGYYNIQKNLFGYVADKNLNNKQIDLSLGLQPQYVNNDSALNVIFSRKKIDQITIFCTPEPSAVIDMEGIELDTVFQNGYTIILDKNHPTLNAKLLITKTFIRPNVWYNEYAVEQTHRNFNSLPAVKYLYITFFEKANDMLDCSIFITTDKPHSFSIEVDGTHSDGDLGAGLELSYQNKNIFHGAEVFTIGLNGAFEAMGKVGQFYSSSSVGGETSLNIPNLIMPFISDDFKRRSRGSTTFSVSYNYQQRPGYTRNIANMGMRYNWTFRRLRFNFNLIDISYIYLPWVSEDFRDQYLGPNSSIRYSYENHFIMRMGFGVNYTNRRENQPWRNYYTLRADIKTAGNVLYLLSKLTNQNKSDDGGYNIFKTRYSQYVKGDFDFTYNHFLKEGNRLVFHANLGIGVPYGNATILPFEERYFSGGANSLRGWSVRTLGPGSYKSSNNYIDFMSQSGDIKLDLSAEARFKLFWILEGAAFLDAGNIWTIRDYKEQPGGYFQFSEFYKQIACSYGVGIRADFSFFVIRVDMGIKLFDPSYSTLQDRWRTDLSWKNDVGFHFAVGYPF